METHTERMIRQDTQLKRGDILLAKLRLQQLQRQAEVCLKKKRLFEVTIQGGLR